MAFRRLAPAVLASSSALGKPGMQQTFLKVVQITLWPTSATCVWSVAPHLPRSEQVDLVALTWLGRGDGTIEDWTKLRAEAARAHNKRTTGYLLGMPLLSDHLEEGLSQFGRSCEEFENTHL